jgi:hypothetical protein
MLQLGVPRIQIHVMRTVTGVDWEEAWSSRGRAQDLADVNALEAGGGESKPERDLSL